MAGTTYLNFNGNNPISPYAERLRGGSDPDTVALKEVVITAEKKRKKRTKAGEFFQNLGNSLKNIGNSALGGAMDGLGKGVSNDPYVKRQSEQETGNLLGKYKTPIIIVSSLFLTTLLLNLFGLIGGRNKRRY